MVLKSNEEYWKRSLENKEELMENFYIIDNIIINDKEFIEKIHRLRELLTSYCCFMKGNDEVSQKAKEKLLDDIYKLLNTTNQIQYSEFIAFWKVLDISYSVYKTTPKDKKIDVLKKLIENYCKRREEIYAKIGYSDVSVQVLYDSGTSRQKGVIGTEKLIEILNEFSKNNLILKVNSYDDLNKNRNCYFSIDKNEQLFEKIKFEFKIKYKFSKSHQGKTPDLFLKIDNKFFIIEAKHTKEGGGGQDKSIVELVEFIKQKEKNNIHYISFMDGVYFNKFISPSKNSKIETQKIDIENSLKEFKQNFFVNTYGFIQMLKDLLKG